MEALNIKPPVIEEKVHESTIYVKQWLVSSCFYFLEKAVACEIGH